MSDEGYTVQVPEGYDEAVVRARLAFRGQGFSILSEMHVGGLLGPEAGDLRQYLIMGVWNSAVSDRAVDERGDMRVAVHLPCNVVVQEVAEGALVAALDPLDAISLDDDLSREVADEARLALQQALSSIGAAS